ncbi:restriction endonuclease subunit S [Aeromonas veronii]|uniref:restriction endonuclease subunit S n=1 Tax=Aeromonas veronii TaxID=654 RepID=UPI003D1D036D
MKAGWRQVKLGDLCKTGAGGTPLKSKKEFYEGGAIPWLLSGEVAQGEILKATSFITQKGLENSSAKLFPPNTVLVAMYGATAGQVGVLRIEASTNQAVCGILPNEHFLPEFLFYLLLSRKDELIAQAAGNAQPNISQQKIRDTLVPVVPLPEQQRIVAILDEAFAAIAAARANAEQNRQNARALFESYLQSVFSQRGEGWVEKPLGNICDFLNGFAFKSSDVVAESQTQLVRMGNLYGNKLDLDRSPVFYPDSFATVYSRYVLEEGDIIMSLTGTTGKEDYGFAVRIPTSDSSLLMNQRIMKFDAIRRDIIDDGYLLHYLRSRCFLDLLYPTANGTRQANLSSVTMKLLPVPLPALKEQQAIAVTLDRLHEETQRLESLYQRKIEALDELKQSLLQQAFSGQL